MQIFHGLDEVPADLGPTALTIGNFDGVHLGHQQVLAQLAEQAQQRQAAAVAVTFDPHPAAIHRPEAVPDLLTGLSEKLSRLASTGLDAVLVLPYTRELSQHTAEEFVSEYFVRALSPAVVVVGHDVRFGRGNEGDFDTMVQLGDRFGFDVCGVEDYEIAGPGARCSSTAIREALNRGEVAEATSMLGRPHAVTGMVVHGEARGRELGFPTANLSQQSEGMVPADGVYAGWVRLVPDGPVGDSAGSVDSVGGRPWPAAISVGSNPTFEGVSRVVEAHVLDRPDERIEDFDLYGQQLRVEFLERLRGMVAYEGVEKLVAQMEQDVEQASSLLRHSVLQG